MAYCTIRLSCLNCKTETCYRLSSDCIFFISSSSGKGETVLALHSKTKICRLVELLIRTYFRNKNRYHLNVSNTALLLTLKLSHFLLACPQR